MPKFLVQIGSKSGIKEVYPLGSRLYGQDQTLGRRQKSFIQHCSIFQALGRLNSMSYFIFAITLLDSALVFYRQTETPEYVFFNFSLSLYLQIYIKFVYVQTENQSKNSGREEKRHKICELPHRSQASHGAESSRYNGCLYDPFKAVAANLH